MNEEAPQIPTLVREASAKLNDFFHAVGMRRLFSGKTNDNAEQQTKLGIENEFWNFIKEVKAEWTFEEVKSKMKEAMGHQKIEDLLYARGPVGEVPIHMCFLYGTKNHLIMASEMCELKEEIIKAEYIGDLYQGENLLHIAVIKKSLAGIEFLLNRDPSLLEGCATGEFFKPGRPCYYGEHPLAFAACTNQFKFVEMMHEKGAKLDVTDSLGNNILHLLVVHNLPDAYKQFKILWMDNAKEEAHEEGKEGVANPLWMRRNNEGLTPFTLAAKLGRKKMFDYLLEERMQSLWSFGPVTCVIYPLDELDDLHSKVEEKFYDGAVEIIVVNSHFELLMNPRIIALLDKKWKAFGERHFWRRIVFMIFFIIAFCVFTVVRQDILADCNEEDQCLERTWFQWFSFVGLFLFVIMVAAWKVQREVIEMKSSGVMSYFSASGPAMLENMLSWGFAISMAAFSLLHFEFPSWARFFLATAATCLMSYFSFFLLVGIPLTGPLVIMVLKMLHDDVLRFCVVYGVFLATFSVGFFVLDDRRGWGGFIDIVKTCFLASFGDFDFEGKQGLDSILLLVVFIVVVSTLMINLLIAMMGDTYGNVNQDKDMYLQLARAHIIFAIENEMTPEERKHPDNRWWVTIKGTDYLQVEIEDEDHFKQGQEEVVHDAGVSHDETDAVYGARHHTPRASGLHTTRKREGDEEYTLQLSKRDAIKLLWALDLKAYNEMNFPDNLQNVIIKSFNKK